LTVIGIIPARAGSRRLPGKNLCRLNGRPLVAWTCEAARASGVLDAVYINTDSPEIAAAAQACGALCPTLRPAHLAADETPTRDANLFLLELLAGRGARADAVMILQPTSPLRTAADIRAAWALYQEHAPCAVVSVSPVAPESWLGRIARGGEFERSAGDQLVYRLNGAIYIHGWNDYVADQPPRRTMAYVMPPGRGIDIDTADDLEQARRIVERSAAPAQVEVGCE